MVEHFIDVHSSFCRCSVKGNEILPPFNIRPERFLFFLSNDFFLITYPDCLNTPDRYSFKVDIIEQMCKKSKHMCLYEIDRGWELSKSLKDYRIKNRALKKIITQVNYIYTNAVGKEFAITTTVNYIDAICNQDLIDENYKKAKYFLEKMEYDFLLQPLQNLYFNNRVFFENDNIEVHKTIEHLTKTINNLTNK